MNAGVIIIEGNIGAGKSTFAQHLAKALDGEYLPEPADGSNPYLEDYYKDPSRWAFEMQMFLLTKRYRAQKYAQSKIRHNGGFVILDRSYYGDVCFANVQRKLLYFSERDYSTYLSHHSDMKATLEPPSLAIFLDVSLEICKNRIEDRLSKKEERKCESGISLDYLSALEDEIGHLAEALRGKTIVKELPWNGCKSDDEIARICENLAFYIKEKSQSVFDFWTGLNGIGA